MTFKTAYNSKPSKGEKNTQPSLTIPDQALTIPEILKRYARGLPLNGNNAEEIWDGEEDILEGVNPKTLDLSEIHELKESAQEELNQVTERLKEKSKKAKKTYKQTSIEDINPDPIENEKNENAKA